MNNSTYIVTVRNPWFRLPHTQHATDYASDRDLAARIFHSRYPEDLVEVRKLKGLRVGRAHRWWFNPDTKELEITDRWNPEANQGMLF